MPRDLRVSITNAPGRGVYPVSSFTWLLMYENPGDRRRSRLMVEFVRWALDEGQSLARTWLCAAATEIVKMTTTRLNRVKVS